MTQSRCGMGMLIQALLVIGGLNWGLTGLGMFVSGANWNVVNLLLGTWPMAEWGVYVVVGVAALLGLLSWSQCCMGKCEAK